MRVTSTRAKSQPASLGGRSQKLSGASHRGAGSVTGGSERVEMNRPIVQSRCCSMNLNRNWHNGACGRTHVGGAHSVIRSDHERRAAHRRQPHMPHACRTLLALLTLLVVLATPEAAQAQRRDGKLSGSVVDKQTGMPLPGVTVVNLLDGKSTLTDSLGGYRFEKLPSGIVRFLFRVPGFPQQGLVVALAQSEVMERRVEMDSSAAAAAAPPPRALGPTPGVQQLAGVTVVETPSMGPRYASFERRRKTGAGQYLVPGRNAGPGLGRGAGILPARHPFVPAARFRKPA